MSNENSIKDAALRAMTILLAAIIVSAMPTSGIFAATHTGSLGASSASGEAATPPENPMSADRVRWEHIQRVYELCGRNVSETARRLNMHRRTLQRILAKRAPK